MKSLRILMHVLNNLGGNFKKYILTHLEVLSVSHLTCLISVPSHRKLLYSGGELPEVSNAYFVASWFNNVNLGVSCSILFVHHCVSVREQTSIV